MVTLRRWNGRSLLHVLKGADFNTRGRKGDKRRVERNSAITFEADGRDAGFACNQWRTSKRQEPFVLVHFLPICRAVQRLIIVCVASMLAGGCGGDTAPTTPSAVPDASASPSQAGPATNRRAARGRLRRTPAVPRW